MLKKYGRWMVFGLVVIGIVALWLLAVHNKNLRQRVESLLLELLIKNKVQDLKDKAIEIQTMANANQIDAETASQEASKIGEAIAEQKATLQAGFESRGMNAEEIASRFRKLNI